MEITMPDIENDGTMPVEFSVSLSAEEAETLATGAYRRIAAALGTDIAGAREKAASMLTDQELAVLLEETVKARAADAALARLGLAFMLAPSTRPHAPYTPGEPFALDVAVHPVPPFEVDMQSLASAADTEKPDAQSPVSMADGERPDAEACMRKALRARTRGTIPPALERDAVAQEHAAFQRELEDAGETYREYRIRTGRKPEQVKDAIRRKAMRALTEDIALETVFREQGLSVSSENEKRMLSSVAPGKEQALRAELDAAGKRWMLSACARRHVALRWAIGNLTER